MFITGARGLQYILIQVGRSYALNDSTMQEAITNKVEGTSCEAGFQS